MENTLLNQLKSLVNHQNIYRAFCNVLNRKEINISTDIYSNLFNDLFIEKGFSLSLLSWDLKSFF